MSLLSVEEHRASSLAWLGPAVRSTLVVAWPLLGVLFVIRRLSGELQPLSPASLLLAGVVLATLAFLLRKWLSPLQGRFLPTLTLVLFAIALSIPGTAWWALVGFWFLLVGEEVWSGWPARAAVSPVITDPLPLASDNEEAAREDESGLLSPEVSQQITRGRTAAGDETLTCLSRVPFASGEQTHLLHIAFCPPLEGELSARHELLEGAPCECKIAALESFGARLEIKRRGPLTLADEALVLLNVVAAAKR